jgi:hypothetical protein
LQEYLQQSIVHSFNVRIGLSFGLFALGIVLHVISSVILARLHQQLFDIIGEEAYRSQSVFLEESIRVKRLLKEVGGPAHYKIYRRYRLIEQLSQVTIALHFINFMAFIGGY